MDVQNLSTVLSIAAMGVTFMILKPLQVQLDNLTDALREIKVIIENSRTDMGHIANEMAAQGAEIKALRERVDRLEAARCCEGKNHAE